MTYKKTKWNLKKYQFHVSLESYQDTKITNYFWVKMLLQYQIRICLSSHSKFDMDRNLFLQNCFYIKLLVILFIKMFDVQYWKTNNICNNWKIKKGKPKNLNVVYLLKCINGLYNFNFYFETTWSLLTKYPPPHQN